MRTTPLRRALTTTTLATTLATSLALTLAATTLAAQSYAEVRFPPLTSDAAGAVHDRPDRALARAESALSGEVPGSRAPEATLALRDLFVSLPRLSGEDRERAERILARPTDGNDDPQGNGYRTRSVKKCTTKLCVHWVRSTSDEATGRWARTTLSAMKKVWRHEIGAMGYRRPVKDGRIGGRGGKFDVYLKELGSQGLYGYCAPEYQVRGYPRLANGYCVLDNDYARSQFGRKPAESLRVTAAHEFFHAVQFGYDYREDPWLMEATATWMEERFADGVNDNRQYLPDSQVRRTHVPLDTFDAGASFQYGNWTFFEFLGMRFGPRIVKKVWNRVGEYRGDGKTYSMKGLRRALPGSTTLPEVYTRYAAANATPGRSYPEGSAWPSPQWAGGGTLGRGDVASGRVRISHLASNHFRLAPGEGLDERRFRLRVNVDGPAARSRPSVTLVRSTPSGTLRRVSVPLDGEGRGSRSVAFNRQQTQRLYVVAVNASSRYDCGGHGTRYSCRGKPLDDDRRYRLTFKVIG
jgi:hypothetical protein